MKIDEVPQDPRSAHQGGPLKKLVYATREDGAYTGVGSLGWEVENFANRQAWKEVEARMDKALERVKTGLGSPIAYFMERSRMDPALLAQYMGLWVWQVRRHLKPRGFARLSSRRLEKYAEVFDIPPDRLIHFNAEKEVELRKTQQA